MINIKIIYMPTKGFDSNRERKKDKKKQTDKNIYNSKHIRMREELMTKDNQNNIKINDKTDKNKNK